MGTHAGQPSQISNTSYTGKRRKEERTSAVVIAARLPLRIPTAHSLVGIPENCLACGKEYETHPHCGHCQQQIPEYHLCGWTLIPLNVIS
jgi:hypothetical protein